MRNVRMCTAYTASPKKASDRDGTSSRVNLATPETHPFLGIFEHDALRLQRITDFIRTCKLPICPCGIALFDQCLDFLIRQYLLTRKLDSEHFAEYIECFHERFQHFFVRRAAAHIFIELRGKFMPHGDRKSTRLNSSHVAISYAVFCLK